MLPTTSSDGWDVIVAQLLAILILLYGMAFLIGALTGNPMKTVSSFNRWLFRGFRKIVAGTFRAIANFIAPGKK